MSIAAPFLAQVSLIACVPAAFVEGLVLRRVLKRAIRVESWTLAQLTASLAAFGGHEATVDWIRIYRPGPFSALLQADLSAHVPLFSLILFPLCLLWRRVLLGGPERRHGAWVEAAGGAVMQIVVLYAIALQYF